MIGSQELCFTFKVVSSHSCHRGYQDICEWQISMRQCFFDAIAIPEILTVD